MLKRCRFALIVILIFSACKEEILHNLTEIDSNRIISHLDEVGIKAEKINHKDNLWSVSVDKERSVDAMRRLESTRAFLSRDSEAPQSSLIPSREDQLYRYERQVSHGIEDTLKTMGGVLEARVHINLPRIETLSIDKTQKLPNSASVLLVVGESFVTNPAEITALVSGGAGVDRERVSVVLNRVAERSFAEVPKKQEVAIPLSLTDWIPLGAGIVGILACLGGALMLLKQNRRARRLLNA